MLCVENTTQLWQEKKLCPNVVYGKYHTTVTEKNKNKELMFVSKIPHNKQCYDWRKREDGETPRTENWPWWSDPCPPLLSSPQPAACWYLHSAHTRAPRWTTLPFPQLMYGAPMFVHLATTHDHIHCKSSFWNTPKSRKMTLQTDWWEKQRAQATSVSEDLEYWRAWDGASEHKLTKSRTPH